MARFTTPHRRELRHAAALYGIIYSRVDLASALPAAVSEALDRGGPTLIEAVVSPGTYKSQLQHASAALVGRT